MRSPVFAADALLDDFIAIATDLTSTTAFGDKLYQAIGLRVMHMMALKVRDEESGSSGPGGAITSEKEGDLSRSYGKSSTASDPTDLASTSWGLELKALQRMCIFKPRNRMMG